MNLKPKHWAAKIAQADINRDGRWVSGRVSRKFLKISATGFKVLGFKMLNARPVHSLGVDLRILRSGDARGGGR